MNNIREFDISLLGFLSEKPMHGYELHRKVTDLKGFGIVWRLKIGKLYAMLNKLHNAKLVSVEIYQDGNRPVRNEFSITKEGQSVFLDWLEKPVLHGRDFRNYFLLKLFFSLQKNKDDALNLIDIQQKECMKWKIRLNNKIPKKDLSAHSDGSVNYQELVNQYRMTHIEADLEWLDWSSSNLREEK